MNSRPLSHWIAALAADAVFWCVVAWLALVAFTPAHGAGLAYGDLPWDAVCEVDAPPYGGSGTLVAARDSVGYVATCSHTFDGVGTANVLVTFRDGYRARARVIGRDEANDLALLKIRLDQPRPLPTGIEYTAPAGESVTAVGFPWYGQGKMHYTAGPVERLDSAGRVLFAAAPHVHSGYSGGALFTARGEYLGAISGYGDDGLSIAGSGEPLRRLLARITEAAP